MTIEVTPGLLAFLFVCGVIGSFVGNWIANRIWGRREP